MKKLLLATLFATLSFGAANVMANHHEGGEHEKQEMEADANNDGKVSYDEFKAAREKNMEEHFKRRDTNGDGFIDQAEKDAAKKNWKEHHGKMKDGEKCERK
jgi:EF hand